MGSQGSDTGQCICFDNFELQVERGELRQSGELIRLPPQPFRVLSLLASHPGDLITREQIQQQLWKEDTFVDFEQGLNFVFAGSAQLWAMTLNPRNTFRRFRDVVIALLPPSNSLILRLFV